MNQGSTTATVTKDTTPPSASTISDGASPTNASIVNYTVTFSEAVTGVDASDFSLTTTGVSGASITSVTVVTGASYTVAVNTGSGDGTIRLDLNSSGTGIQDSAGNPISGGFTGGQVITIDKTTPIVLSITRAAASPTNTTSVQWTVLFS